METHLKEDMVIPGLPQSTEEALEQIEAVENSTPDEWLPLDDVLKEVSHRYEEVLAY